MKYQAQKIPQNSMNQQISHRIQDNREESQNKLQQGSNSYIRLPPNLLRINADNNDTKTMVLYWGIFLFIIINVIWITFLLPQEFIEKINQTQIPLSRCTNPATFIDGKLFCSNFTTSTPTVGLIMVNVKPQHQFAMISADFSIKNSSSYFRIYQQLALKIYKLKLVTEFFFTFYYQDITVINQTGYIDVSSTFSQPILGLNGSIVGYTQSVGYFSDVSKGSYLITATFQRPSQMANIVQDVKLSAILVNPQFTIFTIVIRIIFFVGALISGSIYLYRFHKIPNEYKTIEQILIAVQSVLLLFFNDPLYSATILKSNGFLSFFSVFVVVNFIIFLIFKWIIFVDRIKYQNGQKDTKLIQWKRVAYAIIIYILCIVLYCLFAFYHFADNPIVPTYDLLSGRFLALEIILFIGIALGFLYIFVQYIRSLVEISDKIWRNRIFLYFALFFMILTVVAFFVGGFTISIYIGKRILIIYTAMNMYTYYVQYMYTLTSQERERIANGHIFEEAKHQIISVNSDINYSQVQVQYTDQVRGQTIVSNQLREKFLNQKKKVLSLDQDEEEEKQKKQQDHHHQFKEEQDDFQ